MTTGTNTTPVTSTCIWCSRLGMPLFSGRRLPDSICLRVGLSLSTRWRSPLNPKEMRSRPVPMPTELDHCPLTPECSARKLYRDEETGKLYRLLDGTFAEH